MQGKINLYCSEDWFRRGNVKGLMLRLMLLVYATAAVLEIYLAVRILTPSINWAIRSDVLRDTYVGKISILSGIFFLKKKHVVTS